MGAPVYLIRGRRVLADSPQLQDALADVYDTPERPRCMCVDGGVDMYVVKLRQYVIKRMPGTGTRHHASCESYEPDYGQSGLGALMGEAVVQHAADLVELHIDFPFTLKAGRRPEPGAPGDSIPSEVKVPKQRMSLRAVMHYLFERAAFNRWYPAMLNKRNQQVLHKYLGMAAAEIRTKGMLLSERLLVPEAYSDSRRDQIFRDRRSQLQQLYPGGGSDETKLQLVVGEFKGVEDGPGGLRVWIKHMPDVPLSIDAKAWNTIRKRYEPWFHAASADLPAKPRLILGALVYARREHSYAIETASCMLTTANWIPVEGSHELDLLDALTVQGRRFVKPLRYDAPTAGQFANVLLLDTGPEPTPLHVISGYADVRERKAKERLLSANPSLWVWNTAEAMPDLPPALPT